jgi:hypothetical protein
MRSVRFMRWGFHLEKKIFGSHQKRVLHGLTHFASCNSNAVFYNNTQKTMIAFELDKKYIQIPSFYHTALRTHRTHIFPLFKVLSKPGT